VSAPSPLRGAERRRAQALLFASLVAVGMGQTIVFAVLPPLGREIGLVEVQIGAIISASSIVFFLASPVWGRASDRFGRKRVLLTGLVGYTLGTIVFATLFFAALSGWLATLPAFIAVVLARMGQSSLMSATPPAASAYMADITDVTERTRGMGRIGAANNVGAITGPALGGLLATISLLSPLYFAAAVPLLAAVLVALGLREPPRHAESAARPGRLRYRDARIVPYVGVGVLMFMGFAVVQQTLAFRFQDALALTGQETARTFGLAMVGMAASSLIAQAVIVQRVAWPPLGLLRAGLPLMTLAFVLLALGDSLPAFAGAMAILGLGMGLAAPGFMSGASLAVSAEEQGAVAGITNSCPPLGFAVGPLLGTSLYQLAPHLPYVVTLGLFVPLTLVTFRLPMYRHDHRRGPPAS